MTKIHFFLYDLVNKLLNSREKYQTNFIILTGKY